MEANMDDKIKSEVITSGRAEQYQPIPLQGKKNFYIGIDVGSTSSDIAVLDDADARVFCDYQRTKGKPIETVRSQLDKVFEQISPPRLFLL
jgi:activator of 2-hydroxyglutaryl-CoA dehydratase